MVSDNFHHHFHLYTCWIRNHWRGLSPLWFSVFINLVALRILAILLQPLFSPPKTTIGILVVYVICSHLLLLIWQVIGVLRAAEQYSFHNGFHAPALGAQIIAVMAVILTLPQYMAAYHSTLPPSPAADFFARMEREHASKYHLQLSPSVDTLQFKGLIELGSTRKFRALLRRHPTVHKLVLTSVGGNIYEARGIAKAVMEYGLKTHVLNECSSACTLIFAAGKNRSLAPGARLGFHQYHLEQTQRITNVDPGKEQKRDRKFFLSRGFDADFVTSIFQARATGIWFPDKQQLLSAHAVQQIDVVE